MDPIQQTNNGGGGKTVLVAVLMLVIGIILGSMIDFKSLVNKKSVSETNEGAVVKSTTPSPIPFGWSFDQMTGTALAKYTLIPKEALLPNFTKDAKTGNLTPNIAGITDLIKKNMGAIAVGGGTTGSTDYALNCMRFTNGTWHCHCSYPGGGVVWNSGGYISSPQQLLLCLDWHGLIF